MESELAQTPDGGPRLMSTGEVSAILGVSERTLRRMTTSGQIRHRRIGRTVRFLLADVEAYLEAAAVDVHVAAGGRPGG